MYGVSHAEERVKQPYELVRSLRVLQDRIADGSVSAHGAQRQLMAQIAERLAAMEPEVWKEKKNVYAAVNFVLSGGSPQILRKLLGMDVISTEDDVLVKGALAYGEGRAVQAEGFLGKIDARQLPRSVAGQVALAQAVLAGGEEAARAIKFLDDARVFAPGTLVEESALRREALLLIYSGDLRRGEQMVSAFVRRFPRSVYLPAFFRQLAATVATQKDYGDHPELLKQLGPLMTALTRGDRMDVYLLMAEEAVKAGNVAVAVFAADNVAGLASEPSQERVRAELYRDAALLVTEDYGRGVEGLKSIDRSKLDESDVKLLEAALAMASKLRWPPERPAAGAPAPMEGGEGAEKDEVNGVALGRKVREKAQRAVADTDRLLESHNTGGDKKK